VHNLLQNSTNYLSLCTFNFNPFIFSGKLNLVGKGTEAGEGECLAACDDQINQVSVTSSMFPNRETFVKREEFCITLMKLNRTCNSQKRDFLVNKFPTVCVNIESVIAR
jgi:hypothetical protein